MTDFKIGGPQPLGDLEGAQKKQKTSPEAGDFSKILQDSMEKLNELNEQVESANVSQLPKVEGSEDIRAAFQKAEGIYKDVMQTRKAMLQAYNKITNPEKK